MLHLRIRKAREVKGWKQTAIAEAMGITQQAYSCLEQKADRARLETLNRFCAALDIQLVFLVSDVPITETTMEEYSTKSYCIVLEEHKKLSQKVELFEELLRKKM